MADLGYAALVIALAAAAFATVAPLVGLRWRLPALIDSGRSALWAAASLVSVAGLSLLYLLATRDFKTQYVYQYTSSDMSMLYTLAAFWAGNAGSLLFWAWTLGLCAVVMLIQNRNKNQALMPYVTAIVAVTMGFFVGMMVFVSNPFDQMVFPQAEGEGLNPLLENMGMFLHPPPQLLGYMAFTIPFAFAVAALATGRLGDEWIQSIRRWTIFAWLTLGVGILAGAQWAYVELGWGGYMGWDPVENAALMPWLVGTAFLHSIMVQRRRGMLKVWNMMLIIFTFNLSILGTLLTRSGILSSVHSFSQSGLGPLFVAFIAVAMTGSLALLYYRMPKLRAEHELDYWVSRESTFLVNNLVLVGIAFAVFWGTMFPIITEAVRGVKITVGPPFYNQVTGPLFLILLLVMGICPLIGWRHASKDNLVRNFLYPVAFGVAAGIILFLLGVRKPAATISFAVLAFVTAGILRDWSRAVRARRQMRAEGWLRAFLRLTGSNRPRYGGYIVHLSVVVMALGITGSMFYPLETTATLNPGETVSIGRYVLKFEGASEYQTQSKQVLASTLTVYTGGDYLGTVTPERYIHRNHDNPVTEVAIRSTLKEDLYVIYGGKNPDGTATFKFKVNPMVMWIWIGWGVMLLGSAVAFWPEMKRWTA
ncbi:MAG: heme lyase CcmF/NrfE family subunit [Chloroflexi bacterium]|nr:heme lyase CcmF/NrfE family subunit [Chloroflexota bacterium]